MDTTKKSSKNQYAAVNLGKCEQKSIQFPKFDDNMGYMLYIWDFKTQTFRKKIMNNFQSPHVNNPIVINASGANHLLDSSEQEGIKSRNIIMIPISCNTDVVREDDIPFLLNSSGSMKATTKKDVHNLFYSGVQVGSDIAKEMSLQRKNSIKSSNKTFKQQ